MKKGRICICGMVGKKVGGRKLAFRISPKVGVLVSVFVKVHVYIYNIVVFVFGKTERYIEGCAETVY